MYTHVAGNMKKLALVVALILLPILAGTAVGQIVREEPIVGTVKVERGATLQSLAKITLEQAQRAALEAVPGATVHEGELDEEDGYVVYEIELIQNGREVDVIVDAGTGDVLAIEPEDDRD